MKVEIFSLPDFELHDYDNRDVLEVRVDGKKIMEVYDSYPEDANLKGSFSGCNKIDVLMSLAHEAGKNGEELKIIKKQVPGDILWEAENPFKRR